MLLSIKEEVIVSNAVSVVRNHNLRGRTKNICQSLLELVDLKNNRHSKPDRYRLPSLLARFKGRYSFNNPDGLCIERRINTFDYRYLVNYHLLKSHRTLQLPSLQCCFPGQSQDIQDYRQYTLIDPMLLPEVPASPQPQ